MKKQHKIWTSAACLCLLMCLSCTAAKKADADEKHLLRSYDMVSTITKLGIIRMRLLAPIQEKHANGNIFFSKGFHIINYQDNGHISTTIDANSGIFCSEENVYEAFGEVKLRNRQDSSQLKTEKLIWSKKNARIYTDKHVRIEADGEVHTGEGLEASEDFQSYRILKPSGTLTANTL